MTHGYGMMMEMMGMTMGMSTLARVSTSRAR